MSRLGFAVLDIETGPLPEGEIGQMIPQFEPPANIKDPEKIEARRLEHIQKETEKAALSALTGRVVGYGFRRCESGNRSTYIDFSLEDEGRLIGDLIDLINHTPDGAKFVTFNGHGFDYPFLIRRCWKLGLRFPIERFRHQRYWGVMSVDLREVWNLGDRYAPGSLDTVARHFGIDGKNGTGDQFHKLIAEGRDIEARAYLESDLRITEQLALAMGAVD